MEELKFKVSLFFSSFSLIFFHSLSWIERREEEENERKEVLKDEDECLTPFLITTRKSSHYYSTGISSSLQCICLPKVSKRAEGIKRQKVEYFFSPTKIRLKWIQDRVACNPRSKSCSICSINHVTNGSIPKRYLSMEEEQRERERARNEERYEIEKLTSGTKWEWEGGRDRTFSPAILSLFSLPFFLSIFSLFSLFSLFFSLFSLPFLARIGREGERKLVLGNKLIMGTNHANDVGG